MQFRGQFHSEDSGPHVSSPRSPSLHEDQHKTGNGGVMDKSPHSRLQGIVDSPKFDTMIGLVIVSNLALVVAETDINAIGNSLPAWLILSKHITLVIFCSELAVRLLAHPRTYWLSGWNIMDFLIITADLVVASLTNVVGDVSFLRLLRLLRLARIFIALQMFPELRLMIAGLAGACKSIAWGAGLLFLVIIMWSILAVQLIQPLNLKVADTGVYTQTGCERCPRAFESCFQAFLTLIQQVVAGDSWGQISIPVMEVYPASAVFFFGVLLSVGFAVMNLILSVVVNVAISERDKMLTKMNEEVWEGKSADMDVLLEVCKEAHQGEDNGCGGVLSFDKLMHSCKVDEDFTAKLHSLGYSEDDLQVLRTIHDPQNTGKIPHEQFLDGMYKIQNFDTAYMLISIKHAMAEMRQTLKQSSRLPPQVCRKLTVEKADDGNIGSKVTNGKSSFFKEEYQQAVIPGERYEIVCRQHGYSWTPERQDMEPGGAWRPLDSDRGFSGISDEVQSSSCATQTPSCQASESSQFLGPPDALCSSWKQQAKDSTAALNIHQHDLKVIEGERQGMQSYVAEL